MGNPPNRHSSRPGTKDGPPEARHHMPAIIREYFPILDSITKRRQHRPRWHSIRRLPPGSPTVQKRTKPGHWHVPSTMPLWKGHLPGLPATYRPHQDWSSRLDLRDRALSRRQVTGRARWDEHTQGLSPLRCGDTVMHDPKSNWMSPNEVGQVWHCRGSTPVRSTNRQLWTAHDTEQTLPQEI